MQLTRQMRRAAERQALKDARRSPLPSPTNTTTEPTIHLDRTAEFQSMAAPTSDLDPALRFRVARFESQQHYDDLLRDLRAEHQPATATEHILIESLAQHEWFRRRAVRLIEKQLNYGDVSFTANPELSFLLRYQSTHERGFSQCLNQLAKLRAERRKSQIGFESQKPQSAAPPPGPTPENAAESTNPVAPHTGAAAYDSRLQISSLHSVSQNAVHHSEPEDFITETAA